MDNKPSAQDPRTLAQSLAGAIAWWREAGIANAFHDEPAQWLSPAEATAEEGARARIEMRAAPKEIASDAAIAASVQWPTELGAFVTWWLTDPSLDDGRSDGRVPPRGPREPALMVLVPEPEREDETLLLAGPQGRLLAALLAAAGIAEAEVYIASALPRHMPLPDWPRLAAGGLGDLLTHHVGLVRPKRIVAFGPHVLSLLGHDLPNSAATYTALPHGDHEAQLLGVRSLSALLERPAWKAELWRSWLDWTR